MVTVQGTDHKKFTFLFEKIKLFLFIWLRVRQSEDHLNKTWCDSSPKQSDHCNQLFSFSFCYVLDFSDNIKPKGQQTGYFTRAYCLILFSCVIFTGSLCSLASFKANKKWEILGEAALVFLLVMALMCLCPHLQTEAVVVSLSMSERAHQLWLSSLVHSPRKQNSSWCFPGFDDFSLVPLAWSYWQHTLCFLLSRFSVILLSSTQGGFLCCSNSLVRKMSRMDLIDLTYLEWFLKGGSRECFWHSQLLVVSETKKTQMGKSKSYTDFFSEPMMLNKPVDGERLTAGFSCFSFCHNEILQNVWGKEIIINVLSYQNQEWENSRFL